MKPEMLLGQQGEYAVERYMANRGYQILARNYRVREGEIDLIVGSGDMVACIEVKTRKQSYFPTSMVVTNTKQHRIIRALKSFFLKNPSICTDKTIRFDVAVVNAPDGRAPQITYIENAFYGA